MGGVGDGILVAAPFVGRSVLVAVLVAVRVGVRVAVCVGVRVTVRVDVRVGVDVLVGVLVAVIVVVRVGVCVDVFCGVFVRVGVRVIVLCSVGVRVGVRVLVGSDDVGVGVYVGCLVISAVSAKARVDVGVDANAEALVKFENKPNKHNKIAMKEQELHFRQFCLTAIYGSRQSVKVPNMAAFSPKISHKP